MDEALSGWGGLQFGPQRRLYLDRRSQDLSSDPQRGLPAIAGQSSLLPLGNARSYGDSCLNSGGALIDCRGLDHFIAFDRSSGILRAESGVLLADILRVAVPAGWILPVMPGTQFVTLGGAIANDVHGKNHHSAGSFGCHLLAFELLRSDGRRLLCTPEDNPDLFKATIGGLGLTGVIIWAEIQLKPVSNPLLTQETIRFGNLSEFLAIARDSDRSYEYTVAWVDCLARGSSLGRGLFMRANHCSKAPPRAPRAPRRALAVPLQPPLSLINALSLRAFNALYYHRPVKERHARTVHYQPFFFPLDSIRNWNRLYGPRGFYQYQCVLPASDGEAGIREILERISQSGLGSFLAVLKVFGDIRSPGLLSFPRPGVTLALDFPNGGARTLALLERLDEVTLEHGGALYPAKDARMSRRLFAASFPMLETFRRHMDPAFSSSFWRRVAEPFQRSKTEAA